MQIQHFSPAFTSWAKSIACVNMKNIEAVREEVCHNCGANCPNWPTCDTCGVTHDEKE